MSHPEVQLNHANYAMPAQASKWQTTCLGIGVLAALLCVAGFVMESQREQVMRGYLIGYMLWLGLSLGCLAMLMVQHLSGGLWGLSIRRILEAATKGLPLMLVLWIPLVLGRHYLYGWMSGEGVSANNSWYLNMPFWWLRQVIYFASWLGMMYVLNKRSALQDEPGNRPRFQLISGLGILIYALTISFAAVGAVLLRYRPLVGVPVLALSLLVWELGRLPRRRGTGRARTRHLQLITAGVTGVALAALAISLATLW